jgi:hypothetical protein
VSPDVEHRRKQQDDDQRYELGQLVDEPIKAIAGNGRIGRDEDLAFPPGGCPVLLRFPAAWPSDAAPASLAARSALLTQVGSSADQIQHASASLLRALTGSFPSADSTTLSFLLQINLRTPLTESFLPLMRKTAILCLSQMMVHSLHDIAVSKQTQLNEIHTWNDHEQAHFSGN